MLNRDLEITLNLAFKEARNKRHEFMTVEHLLLALLDNQAAVDVLNACGADLDRLRRELTEFIDSTTPLIPKQDQERETQPTLGFLIQGAGNNVRDIPRTMGLPQQGDLGPPRTKFVVPLSNPHRPQVPVQQSEFFHGETVFAGKGETVIRMVD